MESNRAQWLNQCWLYFKRILALNAFFIFLGFLWRLAFLISFGKSSELSNLKIDVLRAFILGARFDSTVLFYVNAIPLLILLIASLFSFTRLFEIAITPIFKNFARFLIPYYLMMLFIVTFVSAVDLGFYSFYQDRINVLIFGFINDDTWALIKTMWRNYPIIWIFLGLGVFTYLLGKGLRIHFQQKNEWLPLKLKKISYPAFVLFFFIAFVLNGVGARGSLALFPLSEMDTGISKSIFVNHLSFNGIRAFARAIELKSLQTSKWDSNLRHYGYGENHRQAFSDYFQVPLEFVPADPLELLQKRTAKNEWAEKTRPHVILLVMESMGAYWFKYNSVDFDLLGGFKQHLNEDTYITNFLSSSNATIGSLSCLMIGSPQRPVSEFLTESEYLQVPFRSSPARTFKESGYKARFIYGGNPGWREINKFAFIQNFDTVEGETEITEAMGGLKDKHDWGVYDEDVFNYMLKTLGEAQQPQFLLAMTTTNHPPYQLPFGYQGPQLKVPEELSGRLIVDKELAAKRFATYRYSSDKLAQFITKIKNSPLKDKVILAVTGDHSFWLVNFPEQELMQKGSVPFYLYTPAAVRKKLDPKSFGSQADIAPTLYELALSDKEYHSVGRNLFSQTPDFAVNASNLIVDRSGGLLAAGKKINDKYFAWEGPFERLIPGTSNEHQEKLSVRYKSLMGVLDYYFMKEKESMARTP
ncbi:LTA synthase family protein [Bdellovibrio reynosensis]|uniref:Sulfatase-like hydrolase/transferase n=1 Tax=Bdellovibrio reynosensis TaxID=2835041 RepID=A0ABY4C9B8_9BACT|nr:alkaline phosphatase family protein [Bdellovibrio reynosensis]UOF01583.1 sulfatase-like hydrolase/transferase [Bdellovibrio reynosensis]